MFYFCTDMSRHRNLVWSVVTLNVVIAFMICFYCIAFIPRNHNEPMPVKCFQSNQLAETRLLRKNVFYLKTHKTASSTVQNIIMRFGLRHSLNFLLPKAKNYIGYYQPITNESLDEAAIPLDRKFNLFTHHSRYNAASNLYLYEDTIRVTTLRNPPELFESLYQYYTLQKHFNMSFQELLASLPLDDVTFIRETRRKIGYNQMSYDLGMDQHSFKNETAIREFIRYIDQEFDFVMITEYLEASLVMLADLLAWPLHYVSSLPLLKRKSKYKLSTTDRNKLFELNNVDTPLYSYFLEKFRTRIKQYGVSRLIEDVQKLHTINEDLANKCISGKRYSSYSSTVRYDLKEVNDWECLYSTKPELTFTKELRTRQIDRWKSVKKIYEFVNNAAPKVASSHKDKRD